MEVNSYRDLRVWQVAMDTAEQAYLLTKTLPQSELYGMTSQIRRGAASVAANIAEGYGRDTTGAYVSFLRVAQGSLKEVETHLLLCVRVGLVSQNAEAPILSKCDELGRMLRALIRKLEQE